MDEQLYKKEATYATATPLNDDGSDGWGQDEKDMARMGKKQEFQRTFNWISSIGFTSCTMDNSTHVICLSIPIHITLGADSKITEFVALNNFQMLVDGGTSGMFWSYCWVITGQFFIVLSLAEMSSMAPTAGGQYHWVSEFAPRKYQKPLSYVSGWLSSLCWQSFVPADSIFAAQLLMAIAQLHNPDFVVKNWYNALLSILITTMVTFFHVRFSRKLALAETIFVFLHVACFFIFLISIAVASPKNDAQQVFLTFSDNGANFPLIGLAIMVCQVPAMWNVVASDAVAHLSEEVKDAALVTPQTMFWSFVLNIPLAFAVMLVFVFAVTDVGAATTAAFPLVWVLQNSLSTAGAIALTALMVLLMIMIETSCYASTSRQAFAFARDDGFPFSSWMKKVDPRLNVAANACYTTWGFSVVMSLIYLGSPYAFNAILNLGLVALMATYAISVGCVLWRRLVLPETLPQAKWSLGRRGVLINSIGLVYAIFSFFWAFWPIYWNPTAKEMNYAIVMFAGVMFISAVNYVVSAHRKYTGPVATCEGRQDD